MTTTVPKAVPTKVRAIAWTLNNYTVEDVECAKVYIRDQCLYGCFSQETGKQGTPHLQGFIYYENPRAYPNKTFRKLFQGRVHDEMAYSSPHSNRNYCLGMTEDKGMTANPTFWEFGECPNQGSRTDYARALADLRTKEVYEVIDAQPHLIPMINALTRYKQAYRKSTHRDVRVIALIGTTRTGKSRSAWAAHPDLYSKPSGYYWGSYSGQKTVLLDDFTGDLPIAELLKVLDRYPLDLPVKGSYTPALYVNVIITSNLQPRQWYPCAMPEQLDALLARMTVLTKTTYTEGDITSHTHATRQETPCNETSQETDETLPETPSLSTAPDDQVHRNQHCGSQGELQRSC